LGIPPFDISAEKAPKNQMVGVHSVALKQMTRGIRALGRRSHGFRSIFFERFDGQRVINGLRKFNAKELRPIEESMSSETADFLRAYYQEDINLLESLLGKSFKGWAK